MLILYIEIEGYFGGRNVDKPVMCSTNEVGLIYFDLIVVLLSR